MPILRPTNPHLMTLSFFRATAHRYWMWWLAAPQDFPRKTTPTQSTSPRTSQPVDDQKAFVEQLFRTHYAALCRAVYRIVRDQDTAEDIVQDVFLKVWRGQTLAADQPAKAYLFRAAINTALNFLEKNRRNVAWDDTLAERSGENHTEEALDYQETSQRISQALDRLPPKCKVVFSLSRFEDMSYAEIAQHLDISVKAVEKHMGKALKIMRKYVLG